MEHVVAHLGGGLEHGGVQDVVDLRDGLFDLLLVDLLDDLGAGFGRGALAAALGGHRICRRLPQRADAARAMRRLDRLGMRRVRPDPELAELALRLACQHRLTGYDASYVALAVALDGRWLTLDEAAHRRLEALGVSQLAM